MRSPPEVRERPIRGSSRPGGPEGAPKRGRSDGPSRRGDPRGAFRAAVAREECAESVGRSSPERGVIDLIRRVRAGELAPSLLSPEDRRACVGYLTLEGYSVADIAAVLRTSDRTVARDRVKVREENAVEASPELLPRMVGRLIAEADATIGRLRRIGREKETPPAAKVDAERGAWAATRELVQSLQRLGYLPTAVVEVRADLTHRLEEVPDVDALREELERLESIRAGCRIADPALRGRIDETREILQRLAAGKRLEQIASDMSPPEGEGEEEHTSA